MMYEQTQRQVQQERRNGLGGQVANDCYDAAPSAPPPVNNVSNALDVQQNVITGLFAATEGLRSRFAGVISSRGDKEPGTGASTPGPASSGVLNKLHDHNAALQILLDRIVYLIDRCEL